MKFLKYFLITITTIIFISACQKELSFDVDGNAKGTLKSDVSGDCLPSIVNGIFRVDSVLNNTNFIDVQVNLTNTGTYDIKSDTINGYSFRGTGTLGIAGLNTVRLYGSGTPLVAGTDAFTIKFDSSICVVNVIVIGINTGIAVFTLEGAPGTCPGAVVNGIYTAGTLLAIDNTVTLTVNVITPGTYVLGTLLVNGMIFTSTGFFPNPGVQSVTLNGTGLPLAAGTFNLTASNGTSNCTFSIIVLQSGGGAVYTLNTTGSACSGATYTGTYDAGTPLTSANMVLINVTVVTTGTYSIITNTDDGIQFSGAGTFTSTGIQPVTLTGSGTPVAGGVFNYTAAAGVSTCTFSITVTGTPLNDEYLLFTAYSNFSQRLVGGTPIDTIYQRVGPNTITINTNNYSIYQEMEGGFVVDSSYFRKNTGKYYQLLNTQSLGFDNSALVDYLLLDSTLAISGSWIADLGTNLLGGVSVTIKASCNIIDKGATATIAGNSYINVIKVHYLFSYNNGTTNTDFQENEIWFAKGKGFIYLKVNDLPVTTTAEEETTRIQVF